MGTSNLAAFRNILAKVRESKEAEEFVRTMVGKCARSCPVDLLEQLGQCVVEKRRDELHRAAEMN